ncbi:hypothetical protein EV643_12219 [Kribbella sp. VKM Ac-2527]|uniref:DUF4352 domain-containing protein n=2 Tax=Kribbella caucasensis TaxID=2512215 RepID=A0A4V3C6Y2_9ACTN|nr:hypothetical protein EV643_12219 [Kribbella sp. VKM Ac-2527]
MTKPKTRLRFGQRAIVPIEFTGDAVRFRGVVSIVAQAPRKAPASVVAALPEDSRPARGQVVYYVPIVITNESTNNLVGYSAPMLVAKLRSGRSTAYLIGVGGVAECDPHGGQLQLPALGSADRTCVIAATSPKDPLGEIQYVDPPYGYDNEFTGDEPDYNNSYNLGPITWR